MLKDKIQEVKDESVTAKYQTLEHFGMASIERVTEARVYEEVLELLEVEDE